MSAVLSTALLCFLFWLLITGQVVSLFKGQASAQVLIAGAIVSIVTALFSARFFVHKKAFYLLNPVKLLSFVFYCLVIFVWELTKANIDMAKRALSPKLNINPGIVKIPVELKSEYAQAMLANSITLTPGTITMDMVEEKGKLYYYIHWIDVAETEAAKAGEAIKGTLEKWIGRIW
jgi:multicomponent Na+:H+ antiporter subunit E